MQASSSKILATFVAAIGASLGVANASPPSYAIIAITPADPASTIGYDLSDSGQAVGTLGAVGTRTTHAFSYTSQGGLIDLGVISGTQSTAYSVNAAGQTVGMSTTSPSSVAKAVAFGSPIRNLGTLGGTSSVAFGINSSGEIVGQSATTGHDTRAFTMTDGALTNIGTLGGSFSSARAVNDHGLVTGLSDALGGSGTHAFVYDGSMHDIGTLGGNYSAGNDINALGHITGGSTGAAEDALEHAFIYDGTMHDLGTLGGGQSEGFGINNTDTIVGRSQTDSGDLHAFVERDGKMLDLNSLIGAGDALLTYVTLTEARAVNNLGEILANGIDDRTGRSLTFLLTPLSAVPLPPSAILLLTGLGCLLVFTRLAPRTAL